jgi:hypothetical protein
LSFHGGRHRKGGAGFAGVRAPVLQRALKGKTTGKMMLTT